MKLIHRAAAVAAAAALAIGAFGVAIASAGTSESGGSTVPATATKAGHKLLSADERAQLTATGHIEITKHTRRHGDITILVQRGEVTAATATSITLRSKDGYTHEYAVDAATKVRSRAGVGAISDVKVGGRAMVIARRTDAGDTAKRIRVIGPSSTVGAPASQ